MKILIAVLVLAVLIGLFFILYIMNQKTPIPEGCEKLEDKGCNACALKDSCSLKYKKEEKKEDNKKE